MELSARYKHFCQVRKYDYENAKLTDSYAVASFEAKAELEREVSLRERNKFRDGNT